MNSLFGLIKKLIPFGTGRVTRAQQRKLDEISAKASLSVQIILEKCRSWNNSDYIAQIRAVEERADRERAKVLKPSNTKQKCTQ